MSAIALRSYQNSCINKMKQHFDKNNRQLIQMPTGSGKTITFLKYLSDNSKSSLIIVPTRELLEQVEESALHFMHKSQIYAKKTSVIENRQHIVLTAASLNYDAVMTKLLKHHADTIIIDEAHRAHSATYIKFLDTYTQHYPNSKIAGFTATPERADKKPLLEIFDKLTFSKSIYDLIKNGDLCDMESYRIKTGMKFNTRRLTDSGDFSPIALKELDNDSRNQIIYQSYDENCRGKKTLVFCVSVNHAIEMAKSFQKKGINADFIHGALSHSVRQKILREFKEGKITVLFNCQLLTEGFDEPSIEALIIARPTKSKSLYCQMLGRGLRKFPGKDVCYLYELTDNAFNICTFNVACDKEAGFDYEYKNGTRLSQLKEMLDGVSLSDVELVKERINVYSNNNPYLATHSASKRQLEQLDREGIFYMLPINMLEAGFLLWKEELRRKYGSN